jgi:tRNA (adenine22-N1)-methyltransferase
MLKQVRLNQRLALILSMIPESERMIDVGTDHALLPIAAISAGRIKKAIASDIKEGPVERAQKNIRNHGYQNVIEVLKVNGLEGIGLQCGDTVVIAGMGGKLIADILERSAADLTQVNSLILQSMTEDHIVRKWLYENDWHIENEALAIDGRRLYLVISVRRAIGSVQLPAYACYTGTILQDRHDPLSERYFKRILARFYKMAAGLRKGGKSAEYQEAVIKVLEGIVISLKNPI